MHTSVQAKAPRHGARVRSMLRRFGRDEDGSMIIFGLFLLIMMLIVGGMAVDLVRYEAARARLQATLDRAILAAADLDNEQDPEDVVESYFEAAGLLDYLTDVDVIANTNTRTVSADAQLSSANLFMDMVGVNELIAPAAGTAYEAISDLEVILVLDVSGSMLNNSKLNNLKTAAREFVNILMADNADQRVSIGIVPFNGQVNLGPLLAARYAITDNHGQAHLANCVDLPASGYSALDLSTSLSMPMTSLADTYSNVPGSNSYFAASSYAPGNGNRWCPASTANTSLVSPNTIRLPVVTATPLINHINALQGVGATSINAGMRWGVELLDPGSGPMFDVLRGSGAANIPNVATMVDRPFEYDRDNARKVILLMTDGEHFPEERVNAGYRTGVSPIWRGNDGLYSIFHSSRVTSTNSTTICNSRPFWVPHLSAWHSRPWNGTAPSGSACYQPTPNPAYTSVTRQNWQDVWLNVRMQWVAHQLYFRPLGTSVATQMNTFRTQTGVTAMDDQLEALCDMANNNGIIIYGVAFEAPPNGRDAIESCASSAGHYFETSGSQIVGDFRIIANQISMLRLTE